MLVNVPTSALTVASPANFNLTTPFSAANEPDVSYIVNVPLVDEALSLALTAI